MFVVFYIHGDISLNGTWPKDLTLAIGMAFMSDDFRKLFGADAIIGEPGSQVYVLVGRGCLVLSDFIQSVGFLLNRYKNAHGRSISCLLSTMHENDLSISLLISQQDMSLLNSGCRYYYRAKISSDGEQFLVDFDDESDDAVCSSLDGYALTFLGKSILRELYDIDFDNLDITMQSAVRCVLYLDLVGLDFFDLVFGILKRSDSKHFDENLEAFVLVYVRDRHNRIRELVSSLSDFGMVIRERVTA